MVLYIGYKLLTNVTFRKEIDASNKTGSIKNTLTVDETARVKR